MTDIRGSASAQGSYQRPRSPSTTIHLPQSDGNSKYAFILDMKSALADNPTGGGLGLIFLVLIITIFCSISITVAASRCTWAFARDDAIPGAKLWAKVDKRLGVPVWSLILVTVIQMLLGLINIGSSSAFIAFISVGVQALALSYFIPIAISLFTARKEVSMAKWTLGKIAGPAVNVIALLWIAFELVSSYRLQVNHV